MHSAICHYASAADSQSGQCPLIIESVARRLLFRMVEELFLELIEEKENFGPSLSPDPGARNGTKLSLPQKRVDRSQTVGQSDR